MANTIILRGVFGTKQAFNVTSGTLSTGWYAGQLFKIATAKTGLTDEFVSVQSTSGSAVLGIALENSANAASPVYGMTQPSGSKVTVLHGHSKLEIKCASTTKCYEQGSTIGNMESASIMDLVYCSTNGKFTPLKGYESPHPIGYVSKVPGSSNGYTLGVVLFG